MLNSTELLKDCYASFVNLDHRRDRFLKMKESLARAGIEAERTRGMSPKEAMSRCKVGMDKVGVMWRRTPGAIGCHYSQVAVMREALRRGKHAFVMEDDLVFCEDFQARLDYMSRFIEVWEWDVLWLGGTFHVNPPWWHKETLGRDAELTDDPRMIRTYGAFCTYAYIVNRDSLAKVLGRLDDIVHLSMGIDWAFIQLQPELYTFAFVPGCIVQYDNQSDIGKGPTIFSGFKKLGPYWYQKRMEDFDPSTFNWHEANRRA